MCNIRYYYTGVVKISSVIKDMGCFFHLCWLTLSLNKMFVQLCKCLSDSMMLKAWESKRFESWIASNPTRHWKLTWHLSVDYTLSSLSCDRPSDHFTVLTLWKWLSQLQTNLALNNSGEEHWNLFIWTLRFPLQKGHTSINEGWKQDRIFKYFY